MIKHLEKGLVLTIAILISCQPPKNEKIRIPQYPNLQGVVKEQSQLLHGNSLIKSVSLDKETEELTFEMDSVKWEKELSFIDDLDPNLPEYIGAFDISEDGLSTRLKLREGEKSPLVQLDVKIFGNEFVEVSGTVLENKDLYAYQRNIKIQFSDGLIASYSIEGYHKMLWKDTVRFEIQGKIIGLEEGR